MAKDSFVFYREWMPLIKTLPDASRLKFYDMLCVYDGGEFPATGDPHLDGVVQFVFTKVAENNAKYTKKCEKAAESAKMRWDANAYERIESHTNAMPKNANVKNAMLNDNDNDNDNDISFTPVTAVAEPVKQKKSRKSKSLPSRAEVEAFYELEKSNSLKDPLPPGLVAAAAARRPVVTIDALAAAYKELIDYMTVSSDMWPQGMWRCVLTKPDQLEFVQYCKLVLERGMTRAEIKSYLDQWENKGYDNNNLYATIVAWRNREATNPQKSFGGNGQQTATVASVPKRGPKGD